MQQDDRVDVFINNKPYSIPRGNGTLTPKEIREIAMPSAEVGVAMLCTWRSASGSTGGNLKMNQAIPLERGLIINIRNAEAA
jgi:hypothetical protein